MESLLSNLCCHFAARYIGHGDVFPQILAANIINMGSPLILNAFKYKHHRQNVVKIKKMMLWTLSGYYYIVMTMALVTPGHIF